jgi:hypothetical protein
MLFQQGGAPDTWWRMMVLRQRMRTAKEGDAQEGRQEPRLRWYGTIAFFFLFYFITYICNIFKA